MKIYAGIGSRQTPTDILILMAQIAKYLDTRECKLRSGGAKGADTAFKAGADNGFNHVPSEIFTADDCTPEAEQYSAQFHPNWNACSPYAKKLHGRNAMIILGRQLNEPVQFVICWTKDGKDSGGTGQALRIVQAQPGHIPIYNLFEKRRIEMFEKMIANNTML